MGGGFISLGANELSTICTNPNSECEIKQSYANITNSAPFSTKQIKITNATITNFTNYSTITSSESETFYLSNNGNTGKITHLINYGEISGSVRVFGENALTLLENHGTMRGVWTQYKSLNLTINNYGTIKTTQGSYQNASGNNAAHFIFEGVGNTINFQNYAIKITETQSAFNNFTGYTDKTDNKNSHLIIWFNNTDTNKKSKFLLGNLILNFGNEFELGKEYKIDKLITNRDGSSFTELQVDFLQLTTQSSLYKLTQSRDYFIVSLDAPNSEIGILNKSNIRTMNNFWTISNSMVYPQKHNFVILRERSDRRISTNNLVILRKSEESKKKQNIDSALSLKSYESFAYQNESQNQQNRRIQRQNKRNYSHTKRNNNSVILSDSEESKKNQNRDSSVASLPQNDKYYFILTPFVNHNYFFQSGRYNLSGFDYGFLTAFSGKIAESNSLGAHFAFSYGSLNDKHDKDLSITSMNFMLGLNYKLDLVWDMYLKARGDFFYFLNQVKTLTMREAIKPNNLGFGVSVSYGKDFDFKQGGILGIEGGIDYKALSASEITLDSMSEIYKKSLYHLLYVDLGVSYTKYFGNFGINANLGIKGNITANKLAKSKINLKNFNRSVDMILDNDKILGYVNLGASYVLNHRNFDMEFSLAYYGNYGDRVMNNGGGFEWRVGW